MQRKHILWIITSAVVVVSLIVLSRQNERAPKQEDMKTIVALLPLTGPAASTGEGIKKGIELKAKEIRATGGKLQIEYLDSAANPKTAVSLFQKATDFSQADATIIAMSGVTNAIMPLLDGSRLVVATCVADSSLSKPEAGLYRVFLSADEMSWKAADTLLNEKAANAIVVTVNDDYGRSCEIAFRDRFAKEQGLNVQSETFEVTQKDYRDVWKKLLASKPDSIFVAGYGPGYFTVLNQLLETDFQGMLVTDWSLTDPGYLSATNGMRDGVRVVGVRPSRKFLTDYDAMYGADGSFVLSGYAYSAMDLVWKSLNTRDEPDAVKAFADLGSTSTAMGTLEFNRQGGVNANYDIFQIKDGALELNPEMEHK
ncbi:hypothetical protein VN12_24645 [Pirellula sp. SH-Sr6A]|uniref:ABC transporter substrate-binding protein n=1 Tax=Pirellula sp. SH-Sr6A TaxID=1632865 RepID=UPI00078CD365|nr:penicillin-binding protein activator [Pirellula sp. SH-Sr6A]AMV35338.1 hypothetical protein VN12_24645 [Pirellula sp. SH-Sr6A]